MNDIINGFKIRWKLIKDSCLANLRAGLKGNIVDIEEVNYTFKRKSNEWFNGTMAPSLWFRSLEEKSPDKAAEFKDAVVSLRLKKIPYNPPATWWTILVGAMVAISVFCSLSFLPLPDFFVDWSLWVVLIISVGLGILFYYIFDTVASKNVDAYKERYIEEYNELFDKQGIKLLEILQK